MTWTERKKQRMRRGDKEKNEIWKGARKRNRQRETDRERQRENKAKTEIKKQRIR